MPLRTPIVFVFAPLLVLSLPTPVPAQSGPTPARSRPRTPPSSASTKTAAPATTGTDEADALQARFDAATGPQTVTLSPGLHQMSRPVFQYRSGHTVRGASQAETVVMTAGAFPWLVTGVSPAAADGFTIGHAARPDAFGILDASVAPAKGRAWGFDTQKRSIPYLVGHGLNLGRFVNGGWDYWSTVDSFTLRVCVGPDAGGRLPDTGAILGIGGMLNGNVPSPFCFGFVADSAPGHGKAFLATRWKGDKTGAQHLKEFDYGDPHKPHRFLVGVAKGAFFARVDGAAVKFAPSAPEVDAIAGKTLERTTTGFPFQIGIPSEISYAGTGANAPGFVLYGLSLLAAGDPVDPPDDRARYLDAKGHCLGVFRPDAREPGRLLTFDNGAAAGGLSGRAIILDSLRGSPVISNTRVSDLTVYNASPALLTGVIYGDTVERVRAINGTQGFSHIRCSGGSYPTAWRDCWLGGSDGGLDVFGNMGKADNLAITNGGATSIRLTASTFHGDEILLTGFAPSPDSGVSIYGSTGYGGNTKFRGLFGLTSIKGLTGDNENGSAFKDSFINCRQSPYAPTSLTLETVAAQSLGPEASFLKLYGYAPGGAFRIKPLLNATGMMVPACKSAVDIEGEPNVWRGSFQTISDTVNMTGPGLGRVKVVAP